jgi:hypothetical protein
MHEKSSLPARLAERARATTSCGSARGALLLFALGLVACDRDDASAARRSECSRFCGSLEKCDDATDLLDCRDQCEDDDVRSDRYYRARADCGEKLSCSRWVNEVNGRGEDVCTDDCNLVDCVDDALAELKLSDDEQQACMALATKLNACEPSRQVSSVIEQCEAVIPVLSKAYLDDSERCGEQACAEIPSCFAKLSDRHQTDLTLYPGR